MSKLCLGIGWVCFDDMTAHFGCQLWFQPVLVYLFCHYSGFRFPLGIFIPEKSHSRVERLNFGVSIETLDFARVHTFYQRDRSRIAGRGCEGGGRQNHLTPTTQIRHCPLFCGVRAGNCCGKANKRSTNSKREVIGGNYPAHNRPVVGRSLVQILRDQEKKIETLESR